MRRMKGQPDIRSVLRPKNDLQRENPPSSVNKEKSENVYKALDQNSVQKEGYVAEQRIANDISNGLSSETTLDLKLELLVSPWIPPRDYEFPLIKCGKQNRKFNFLWLEKYPWLCYSKVKEGAFCKCCLLFGQSAAGRGSQELRQFVKVPWTKYYKAKEDLDSHSETEYHLLAQAKSEDFRKIYVDKSTTSVALALNQQTQKVIESNRRRLRPIVETVLLCARLGLPLRGHRDTVGPINSEDTLRSCLNGNHGTFLAILSSKLQSGDPDLSYHLETTKKSSTLVSWRIQNEIIDCIGSIIVSQIVSKIKQSKYYSLLADESTDISGTPQLSVCLRYVDLEELKIHEDFLGFQKVASKTGKDLKNYIQEYLGSLGLEMQNIRGPSYDGGANMAGRLNGLQALIVQDFPVALFMHCCSHSLNLALSSSCEIPHIRNMLGIVGSICTFFRASSKRIEALETQIESSDADEVTKSRLKPYCPTRWVERHDSIAVFKELYAFVLSTLALMKRWRDSSTSSNAASYEAAMTRPDFLVALEVLHFVFSYTITLSKLLQQPTMDLSQALQSVELVLKKLLSAQKEAIVTFSSIFSAAMDLAKMAGVEIKVNRTGHRKNKESALNPEEYYRTTIFVPFLENVIHSLESRFGGRLKDVVALQGLIPAKLLSFTDEQIVEAAKIYRQDWMTITDAQLQAELALWRAQWESHAVRQNDEFLSHLAPFGMLMGQFHKYKFLLQGPKPTCAVTSMERCSDLTPTIKLLLQLFATLPITTASAERSFSVLRRLKSYLRSTMGEDRLNGLALCNIYKDASLDTEEIIERFARFKPRRLQFGDWSEPEEDKINASVSSSDEF